MTNKEKVLEAIRRLPDDISIDRAIDELCWLQNGESGCHAVEIEEVITHEDIKKQLLAGHIRT
ncbi:MAG TPA: hypothetical protein VKU82_14980 [Planctomycetaceae bacterium]|nr:hypothetical protein [Planctomycetaceae bacterium]